MTELESQFVQWKPPQSAEAVKELMANVTADLPATVDEDAPTSIDIVADGVPIPVSQSERTRRAYVCGPMRGVAEFNAPAFNAAEEILKARGFEVFTPVSHDAAGGFDHHGRSGSENLDDLGFDIRKALGDDLAWITANADVVFTLPGWENSRGANAEVKTALALDIPVEPLYPESKKVHPGQLCEQAAKTIGGPRQEAYGDVQLNWKRIGILWRAWAELKATLPEGHVAPETDVWALNVLQKMARAALTQKHTDSYRDIIGYTDLQAVCAGCDPAK